MCMHVCVHACVHVCVPLCTYVILSVFIHGMEEKKSIMLCLYIHSLLCKCGPFFALFHFCDVALDLV